MSDRDEYTSDTPHLNDDNPEYRERDSRKTIYDILNDKSQFGKLIDFLK